MKKVLSILLILASLCTLISCSYFESEPTIEVNKDGYVVVNGVVTEHKVTPDITKVVDSEIHYPMINSGTKIEDLPLEKQQIIDDYVADCKTIYTANYASKLLEWNYDMLGQPYLSFDYALVYDFSKVNESSMDEKSAQLWNQIKALNNGESAPMMYVELSGFVNFFGDAYKPTTFVETGYVYGYFIFENETVVRYNYKTICQNMYIYKLPDGTEIINCGNKYAEEKDEQMLMELIEQFQSLSPEENPLNRLTVIK